MEWRGDCPQPALHPCGEPALFPARIDTPRSAAAAGGSSQCYWKGGEASYFDVLVAGAVNLGAAWTYEETAPIARPIENWIAFWQGVETGWDGEGDGQPQILEHAIPSVAKALGVDKVHWRPTLDIPGLEGEFTGYRVDSPPALWRYLPRAAPMIARL